MKRTYIRDILEQWKWTRNILWQMEKRRKENRSKEVENIVALVKVDFIDQKAWDSYVAKNKTGPGAMLVAFARRWAALMQHGMQQEKSLDQIAEQTKIDADFEGLSGFAIAAAVRILSKTWCHGQDLRRWHNRRFGQEDTHGVINPALINPQGKRLSKQNPTISP